MPLINYIGHRHTNVLAIKNINLNVLCEGAGQLAPKTTRPKTTRPTRISPKDNSLHIKKTTRPKLGDNSPHIEDNSPRFCY